MASVLDETLRVTIICMLLSGRQATAIGKEMVRSHEAFFGSRRALSSIDGTQLLLPSFRARVE
jgi:hypothetical protein